MSDAISGFPAFLFFRLLSRQSRGKLRHHEEGLEKDSALYQLMDTRMNGVMNGIVSDNGEYQAILRNSDIYCKQEIIRTYSKSPIFAKLCLNES